MKVQNTTVINGWKVKNSKNGNEKEFDFLIILESLKAVIHIEVKKTLDAKTRIKAAKQLESGQKLFLETVPLPKNEGWKYIGVMCGSRMCLTDDACTNKELCICKHLVISLETDLDAWWNKLTELIGTKTQLTQGQKGIHTYIQICKFLLHQLFQQEQCITQEDITLDSERNIKAINTIEVRQNSGKEICFLTKVQFSVFHDQLSKKIAFASPYGTGKTTLLKAKARELASRAIEEELVNKTKEMRLANCAVEEPQAKKAKYFPNSGFGVVIVLFDDEKAKHNFLLKTSYDLEFEDLKEKVKIVVLKKTGKSYFYFYFIQLKSSGDLKSSQA